MHSIFPLSVRALTSIPVRQGKMMWKVLEGGNFSIRSQLYPSHNLWPQVLKSHAQLLSQVQLCDPMNCSLPGCSVHGISQATILLWGWHFLLQGIFPTQGSNPWLLPHILHCRWILYHWATWKAPSSLNTLVSEMEIIVISIPPSKYWYENSTGLCL